MDVWQTGKGSDLPSLRALEGPCKSLVLASPDLERKSLEADWAVVYREDGEGERGKKWGSGALSHPLQAPVLGPPPAHPHSLEYLTRYWRGDREPISPLPLLQGLDAVLQM